MNNPQHIIGLMHKDGYERILANDRQSFQCLYKDGELSKVEIWQHNNGLPMKVVGYTRKTIMGIRTSYSPLTIEML